MQETIYKIDIDVNGAPSGSERLAVKQGEPISKKETKAPQKISTISKFEELIGKERFKQIRNTAGGATAVGVAGLSIYIQNAKFKGDSNTIAQIGEVTKWAGRGAATSGLLLSGNFTGAGLYVAYTAFSLAKENREMINTRLLNEVQSSYYQQRLIYDVSQRSR